MASRIEGGVHLCCLLSDKKGLKATVKGSFKGAIIAGVLALVGGLIGGPLGIAIGGAVGGLLGYWMTRGTFEPLSTIIMELKPEQKKELSDKVMAIVGDVQWTEIAQLTAFVMGEASLMEKVIAAVLEYITKELQADVVATD
ncbi:hypothetical protein UPYG_G00267560 [Umbra pygmaea]|uniref:CS012 protein n=1 Tax=Umbra pygmaea TaxID=75934 RepID=A0ABD0WBR0_UMBPY